ncbi:hypothetical protein BJ085DRAFT_37127 [Dimargaris cristalligena]|uniref:Amine oxidase domain-containing protein n=1 Tax=Dimargaris cristalligena TaxID=215637 RepID=A0A4P9ZUP1_9FUNG|nr:hypothetical protein BJ085DRAFT_37127 [Dimargaris cristalligena]|eukprot:RKP37273.1 hypothetical protein BJ085DRAFT_37127 [Dimargaris cristalligena]
MHIVVLGGGLSGLSTAHYLARRLLLRPGGPAVTQGGGSQFKITVLEAQDRWGGWVDTRFVPLSNPEPFSVAGGEEEGSSPTSAVPPSTASVLFETGPRTFRPSGSEATPMRQLLSSLDLYSDVAICSRASASAKNRFIYYQNQLNRLPTGPASLLFQRPPPPILRGLWGELFREPWRVRQYPFDTPGFAVDERMDPASPVSQFGVPAEGDYSDESIHRFMTRHFGPTVADNLVSAMIHGIYAGDVHNLSVDSTMRWLKDLDRQHGSLLLGLLATATGLGGSSTKRHPASSAHGPNSDSDASSALGGDGGIIGDPGRFWSERAAQLNKRYLQEHQATTENEQTPFWQRMAKGSVYSFHQGSSTLIQALVDDLSQYPTDQVQLAFGRPVHRVEVHNGGPGGSGHVAVHTSDTNSPIQADHVISALPGAQLHKILADQPLPLLNHNPNVDMAVVNFAYAGRRRPVDGFGYLVPQSVTTPVLGAVFDSCSSPEQDQLWNNNGGGAINRPNHPSNTTVDCSATSPPLDRITVLMGGYRFEEMLGHPATYFQNPEGLAYLRQRAQSILDDHIGPVPTGQDAELVASHVQINRQCLPQYVVGHRARLQALRRQMGGDRFAHRLSVTGASYLGPSMNACVLQARQLVDDLVEVGALSQRRETIVTGIDRSLI